MRQVITVNIYRNMHEAFQTFDYISQAGNFGWVSREAGAWQPAPPPAACWPAGAVMPRAGGWAGVRA